MQTGPVMIVVVVNERFVVPSIVGCTDTAHAPSGRYSTRMLGRLFVELDSKLNSRR